MKITGAGGHHPIEPQSAPSHRPQKGHWQSRRVARRLPRISIRSLRFSPRSGGPRQKSLFERRIQARQVRALLSPESAPRPERPVRAAPSSSPSSASSAAPSSASSAAPAGPLLQEGGRLLKALISLDGQKKNMKQMPFQSPQRRIEGMQIQIRKKQIEQAIAQFNDKAQQAGQPELSLDMRQIELGLVNSGRGFVENNANYKAFLNAAQKPRQNPASGHDGG